jgi:hypothetical protein
MVIINGISWHFVNGGNLDSIGLIPSFLDINDPRPVRQQFDEQYVGGWTPFSGHTMNPITLNLLYPEDPPTKPLAIAKLREEVIIVYEHAWVAIVQSDRQFEVCRMD